MKHVTALVVEIEGLDEGQKRALKTAIEQDGGFPLAAKNLVNFLLDADIPAIKQYMQQRGIWSLDPEWAMELGL